MSVLSLGCTPSAHSDWTIDIVYDPCQTIVVEPSSDTTAAELAAVDEAIRKWRDVAHIEFERAPGALEVDESQRLVVRFEEASLAFRGVYQDEVGDVIVNRRLGADPDHLAIVLAHELGHALGLFHIDDRPSVMNRGNLEIAPLAEDAADLEQIWGPCISTGPQQSEI